MFHRRFQITKGQGECDLAAGCEVMSAGFSQFLERMAGLKMLNFVFTDASTTVS